MRRRALLAASAASGGGGKPINIIQLHPFIDMDSLSVDYELSDVPTSDIYIGIETTGLFGYTKLYLPSGIQTGIKNDVDLGCSTSNIEVTYCDPMEDDNFVYKVEVI